MELLKQLREMTGAGIVDCQKALKEANNNLDKAVEILRKKGIAKAAKRAGHDANEGIIKLHTNTDNTEGYILELDSETDFVARNEKFQSFADQVLESAQENKVNSLEELLVLPLAEASVQESLDVLSGTIGEKMSIKRFAQVKGATVAGYSHLGGRIGVLVALDSANKTDIAIDIAMQIAAVDPKYLSPADVPAEELAKEKEIYREQLLKEGKPENMIDKIIMGKLNRYYTEVCLLEQEFIKEDKKKIKDLLGEVKVLEFVRYAL